MILRDVKYRDMEALLRFMYNGEVSVSNEQLPSVLHTARMLQVKGLADVPPTKHYANNKRVSLPCCGTASSPASLVCCARPSIIIARAATSSSARRA